MSSIRIAVTIAAMFVATTYHVPAGHEAVLVVNNAPVTAPLRGVGSTLVYTAWPWPVTTLVHTTTGPIKIDLPEQRCNPNGTKWELPGPKITAEVVDPVAKIRKGGYMALSSPSRHTAAELNTGMQLFMLRVCSSMQPEDPMHVDMNMLATDAAESIGTMVAPIGIRVRSIVFEQRFEGRSHDIDENYAIVASQPSRIRRAHATRTGNAAVHDTERAAQAQALDLKRAATTADIDIDNLLSDNNAMLLMRSRNATVEHYKALLAAVGPAGFRAVVEKEAVAANKGTWISNSAATISVPATF